MTFATCPECKLDELVREDRLRVLCINCGADYGIPLQRVDGKIKLRPPAGPMPYIEFEIWLDHTDRLVELLARFL